MKKFVLIALITLIVPICFFGWTNSAIAGLPPGNRVKDPYTILRNALPINQKDLRELQNTLEDVTVALKGNRWSALSKAASRSQFLASNRKKQILESIPKKHRKEGEGILELLKDNLENLSTTASEKNKTAFSEIRLTSLQQIGKLESLLLTDEFPFKIPNEYDNLPRLLGRASVSIETTKGTMQAIIDGYNAPLTSGAFVDLALRGFYDHLPINRAEEFFILQSGDPKGPDIGFVDPETKEERNVPLEIRVPEEQETLYNQTFEELGLYTATPTLPFATLGTMGWSHSNEALDDGSSQFFFFLYEAELNPAGRNLIDGRNAAFGYVIEGEEILNKLDVDDEIVKIKVIDGSEKLKSHG